MKWRIALTALLVIAAGSATAGENDRMLYLTVKYADGGVELEDARVVGGRVKTPRQARSTHGRLHFSVTAEAGETLFEGSVPDPTLLRVEYVDDEGRLQRRTARRDAASFTIRVPYDPRAHRVTIRRFAAAPKGAEHALPEGAALGSFSIAEEVRRHAD
jgi:hypothetical protein